LRCGSWLPVQPPSIPFGLWPVSPNVWFQLFSNPPHPHTSILGLPLFLVSSTLAVTICFSLRHYSSIRYAHIALNIIHFIKFKMSAPCNTLYISLFIFILQFFLILLRANKFLNLPIQYYKNIRFLWDHCRSVCVVVQDGSSSSSSPSLSSSSSSSCSWRVRRVSCSLILKMKLVPPIRLRSSYVPSSFWSIS